MSCREKHSAATEDSGAAGCPNPHPAGEQCQSLPRFQFPPADQHGSWNAAMNFFPFFPNGAAFDGKTCCLGIPHCLLPAAPPPLHPPPQTPAHCVLENSPVKQQHQQQQQPVWFYSKLSQLQFLSRLFHSNLLGNFLCDESFHGYPQVTGGGNFYCKEIPSADASVNHQTPARHVMGHPPSSCDNPFFHHLLPPPPPLCSVARFPSFQVPAACNPSAKLIPQKLSIPGSCEPQQQQQRLHHHHQQQQPRCSGAGEEALVSKFPGTDSCLLCQSRAPPADIPMNLSARQDLLPALGIPMLQAKPQFNPPTMTSQQWTQQQEKQRNDGTLKWSGVPPPPCQGVAENTSASNSSRLFGEQSATAATQGNVASPQSTISQLCGPLQEMGGQRNRVKGQWSLAEDKSLVKLVKQYGTRRWSLISTFMANRSGKQCRERWVNHLQPDIRKEGWTKEEEELLVQAHSYFGNKWSAIAKMLPGRTDNSIKNHWHAALRKKDRHGKLRSNLLREYIQQKMAKADSSGSQEETTTSLSMAQELAPTIFVGATRERQDLLCSKELA